MNELLTLLAELSVTIAALSAVAGAAGGGFGNRSLLANELLRDVALVGLLVAFYSILPMLLVEAAVELEVALKLSGSLAGASWLLGYLLYIPRVVRDRSQINFLFLLGFIITITGLLLFATSALQSHVAAYLAGLVSWLAIAGLNFIAAVFGPSNESA